MASEKHRPPYDGNASHSEGKFEAVYSLYRYYVIIVMSYLS
jgi:hypothetical protein